MQTTTRYIYTACAILQFACGDKETLNTDTSITKTCEDGDTVVAVVSTFSYARIENGVVWGFDLDGLTSTNQDYQGCYKNDLVDPLGNTGIDNAFSALIPALESTEAVALESLVQQSINVGNLLMLIEITGVQDVQNDDCVNVHFYRGTGTPLVGTDGLLLDGQSFYKDLDLPYSGIEGMSIIDGVLVASPLDITLPVDVLDEHLNFEMFNGGIYMNISPDGYMHGFFGGALPIQTIVDITQLPDVNLPDAVVGLVASAADLYPNADGTCDAISLAFQYEAIPAHFVLESP